MKDKPLRPLLAIRKYCLSCAGRPKDVRLCNTPDCSLYPFRQGKNPNRAGIGVGVRDKNGQFKAIFASPAGEFKENNGKKTVDKAKANLINQGAKNGGSKISKINMVKKGKIQIRESAEKIVVTLTKE